MKAADYIRNFVSENEDKYSMYEGYSGRGMFGRKCFGVIVKEGNSCMEFMMDMTSYLAKMSASDDGDFDLGFAEDMSYDNLGKDYIVYFPAIESRFRTAENYDIK